MTRTGVCVPLEEHTGLEPARSAWKAETLPITSMLRITAQGTGGFYLSPKLGAFTEIRMYTI